MNKLPTKLKKNEKYFSDVDLIAYEKHSLGCIELHKDFLVIYSNILPFRNFIKGRSTTIINLRDIKEFAYKGTGWFPGFMAFGYKHFVKPEYHKVFVWWVWNRKKFNNNLTPIIEYISNYVLNASRSENYHKVEMAQEITKKGYCPVCGNKFSGHEKFCTKCGYKVK